MFSPETYPGCVSTHEFTVDENTGKSKSVSRLSKTRGRYTVLVSSATPKSSLVWSGFEVKSLESKSTPLSPRVHPS